MCWLFLPSCPCRCETCAYPDSPCRHPDKRVATVESHGIMLMQTVEP
ncbi:MAG: DUF2284 domain-containing protein [Blautia sp.]